MQFIAHLVNNGREVRIFVGEQGTGIALKANYLLRLFLIVMFLIGIRLWHLTVVQHDERAQKAARPRHRWQQEPAERGTIRDRMNVPLAVNKICYQAAVRYAPIRDLPRIVWRNGEKVYYRKEYIRELSLLLAKELQMDAERIEDLIHSKAALWGERPFILSDDLSEEAYYRLRMLERSFPGLVARRTSKRSYPRKRLASHVLGYLGAINAREYETALLELRDLQKKIKQWESGEMPQFSDEIGSIVEVYERLRYLRSKAYSLADWVGKSGIEGYYEKDLRGYRGYRGYYVDARGRRLYELPGAEIPQPGQRILLTLSAELQEYCEQLLARNERIRDGRSRIKDSKTGQKLAIQQPWIKGGAIVVMDPREGELLALASYPRFDPNDFVDSKGRKQLKRWLENDHYLASLWEMKEPQKREEFDGEWRESERWLDWSTYLSELLPETAAVSRCLQKLRIQEAIEIQRLANIVPQDQLKRLLQEEDPTTFPIRNYCQRLVGEPIEPRQLLLILDLSRMIVPAEAFSYELLDRVGSRSIAEYHQDRSHCLITSRAVKEMVQALFKKQHFDTWRKEEGKDFLKEKRREEQEAGRYARPYLDYFDAEEARQFALFWEEWRWELLAVFLTGDQPEEEEIAPYADYLASWFHELAAGAHAGASWYRHYHHLLEVLYDLTPPLALEYLASARSYQELSRPLFKGHPMLRGGKQQTEQHLASGFYPKYGFGHCRSFAYGQAAASGSVFKLVTAYEALRQQNALIDAGELVGELNPLTIIDHSFKVGKDWAVGERLDGRIIPRLYKGGVVPRSLSRNIGRIDLVGALGESSNPYFALLTADHLEDPNDLNRAASALSFGQKTGVRLTGEAKGFLPDDLEDNQTGLYSYAIGQHRLLVTPLQTAVMLSALVNGGAVHRPQIVRLRVGSEMLGGEVSFQRRDEFPYQEPLRSVGIDFPLFVSGEVEYGKNRISLSAPDVIHQIDTSEEIEKLLKQGLQASLAHALQGGGGALNWVYGEDREAIDALKGMRRELAGKTSTAEITEWIDLTPEGLQTLNHIWFGGIGLDEKGDADIVVVVFLRYGGYGKEAAPVAAQVIKKWREIQKKGLSLH